MTAIYVEHGKNIHHNFFYTLQIYKSYMATNNECFDKVCLQKWFSILLCLRQTSTVIPQICVMTKSWYTVWKFHDFSITQILREINFGHSRSARFAILTQSEALNFDFNEFLHFLEAEIYWIDQIQSPKNCKNGSFRPS